MTLYKKWVLWRRRRRLLRECKYLVREIQRIFRLYATDLDECLGGPLTPTRWGKTRHRLKAVFTLGLWFVYRMVKRRSGPRLSREVGIELAEEVQQFHRAMERGRLGRAHKALESLDQKVSDHLGFARKSTVREYAESIGIAVFVALLLRAFVVEAFKIPSGSMIPTLEIGDHIFVNKFSYGLYIPFTKKPPKRFVTWSEPKRGDVIVFIHRQNVNQDFIKRVIALGGDEVKVERGTISLRRGGKGKWKKVKRTRLNKPCEYQDLVKSEWKNRTGCAYWMEELDGTRYLTVVDEAEGKNKDFPPMETYRTTALPMGSIRVPAEELFNVYRVPNKTLFVMGDNRTNSGDSRFPGEVGFVDHNYVKGKALLVWSSWGPGESWWGLRWRRIGQVIH